MFKSVMGTIILVGSIPTFGCLLAGQVCFLMGVANIPGYRLWKKKMSQNQVPSAQFGILLSWLGQSIISLCFAWALVYLTRLFFRHFEFYYIFQWAYWVAIFFLSIGPAFRSLRISEQTAANLAEGNFYRFTLILTLVTTVAGFIVFTINPL